MVQELAVTREKGRAAREELDRTAEQMVAGDVLEIDLTAVKAMTISFADEFIGRFIASRLGGEEDDRGIVIRGQGDDIRETLDAILTRRGVGALYLDEHDHAIALGGPTWFADTVAQAQQLQTFRATDLAKRLDLSPQAANGRLRKLTAAGAVLRQRVVPEGGGKEFEYRVAMPTA